MLVEIQRSLLASYALLSPSLSALVTNFQLFMPPSFEKVFQMLFLAMFFMLFLSLALSPSLFPEKVFQILTMFFMLSLSPSLRKSFKSKSWFDALYIYIHIYICIYIHIHVLGSKVKAVKLSFLLSPPPGSGLTVLRTRFGPMFDFSFPTYGCITSLSPSRSNELFGGKNK